MAVVLYFEMLYLEAAGQRYFKTEYIKKAMSQLKGRSKSSVELKWMNISAVLIEMGQPSIIGYKPYGNVQQLLKTEVRKYLGKHSDKHDKAILQIATREVVFPTVADWDAVLDTDVGERFKTGGPLLNPLDLPPPTFKAIKRSFTELERANRQLGEQGELFVMKYEQHRLMRMKRPDLAQEVEWSSKEKGDGLGYDIRSFDKKRPDDSELFIEVKTTTGENYRPFYITENEVAFARRHADKYALYRVFDFQREARFFLMPGAVEQHVHLNPQTYKAYFRKPSSSDDEVVSALEI